MAFSSFNSSAGMQPMNEINTTPLVDVMLVLLVIFLITAPLLNQAVPVDLPKVDASQLSDTPTVIQLSIDENGDPFVNGIATEFDNLEAALKGAVPQDQSQTEVHLRADRHTEYERVAQAMASVNKAGLTRISFVTESPPPVRP